MDFDSQPKPESKLMSLVFQTVSLLNFMDFGSLPKPLWKLISLFSQAIYIASDQETDFDSKLKSLVEEILELKPDPEMMSLINQEDYVSKKQNPSIDDYNQQWKLTRLIKRKTADRKKQSDLKFRLLVEESLELKPYPELISLIPQIVSLVISMKKCNKLVLLRPQVQVSFHEGKFLVEPWKTSDTWNCFVGNRKLISLKGDAYATHFHCKSCNGQYHKVDKKAPFKINHPLHRKHPLQLALNMCVERLLRGQTRKCYCCDDYLIQVFHFFSSSDFAMNIACVEKPLILSIPHSKWHEHPLALYPRKTSLTCDICALADSDSPFYICPPCDFVAYLKCINLPLVLRISCHPHRIRYIPSFDQGIWSCSVCRKKMDNDYGGYSCIMEDCLYTAHSRCATQRNVWDGIELEGVPEETEEESLSHL